MDIPEEDVEQAIIWDPAILKIRSLKNLQLIERQKPLDTARGFIDLLFRNGKHYVIVELKRDFIKNRQIVTNQVLRYREALMQEFGLPANKILCVLATTQGFSDDVKKLCKVNKIIARRLDENRVLNILSNRWRIIENNDLEKTARIASMIFERRKVRLVENEWTETDLQSLVNWLNTSRHDELARKRMADLFVKISEMAPICAHEVNDYDINNSDYGLKTEEDMWFWLFYTVLDKRSNASTFIKARRILENANLFLPTRIMQMISMQGREIVADKITEELEKHEFPLIHDYSFGKYTVANAIINAAELVHKYDYSFEKMYQSHLSHANYDLQGAYRSIWEEIQSNIHGVGPRMAAQFIRGMVLKGPWKLPLTDDGLLEKSKYNVFFAGPARLSLIEKEEDFTEILGNFADKHLNGNRAIISHVLWYIRKKYCGRAKHCNVCPMAGYCSYFLKINSVKIYKDKQETLGNWIPSLYPFDLEPITSITASTSTTTVKE